MADFKKYFSTLIGHEGGYSDHPYDKGGPTKYGVTLGVWIKSGYDKDGDGDIDKDDVKLLTLDDAYNIAKKNYWDSVRGDQINNQSIAEFIFDWGYNSGAKTAIKKTQEVLGVVMDGEMGPNTLLHINSSPQEDLFNRLKARREKFFRSIADNDPTQLKFLSGWLNRNNSFKFIA